MQNYFGVLRVCVRAACLHVCMRACVRACVHAYVHAYVYIYIHIWQGMKAQALPKSYINIFIIMEVIFKLFIEMYWSDEIAC